MLIDICASLAPHDPAGAFDLTMHADGMYSLTLRDGALPLAALRGVSREQLAGLRGEIDRVLADQPQPEAICPAMPK